MPAFPVFLSALLVFALAGCTPSYQVVEVPQYGADLYPTSQTKAGITIAIDEIRRPDRAERYFGSDLIREGILPVNVVVSNYSKQSVTVRPSDILLYRGKEVIDPLPIPMIVAMAKRQHRFLASSTAEEVNKFFGNSTFKEAVLLPNESYRGVVFFAPPAPKGLIDRWFTRYSTYSEGGPRIRMGVTHIDSGDRLLFGPFPVALPEN
jgi:hypothetical protein